MIEHTFQKLKVPVVLVYLFVLLFGFFCVGMFDKTSAAMEVTHDKTAVSIEAKQECCGGTMSEHMQSWTNTFLTIPREGRDMLTLFALGLLLAFVVVRSIFSQKPPNDFAFSYRQYLRHHPNLFALQPLRLAFARGILNPKVF